MKARARLVIGLGLALLLLVVGTIGFHVIEGWPWFDCLYHTVITLSTVGYAELHPLSQAGRAFTIGLIVVSFVGMAVTLQALTSLVVEWDLDDYFGRRRMDREIAGLSDHVIVCGHGRMGGQVASELAREGLRVVVIESDPVRARAAAEAGHLVVTGDATSDETLRKAGAERARAAACALASDADNVFTTLSLRGLNPALRIVSRHDDVSSREKLLRAGADRVVSPQLIGGYRMASLLLRPATPDALEVAPLLAGLDVRFAEVTVLPTSELADRTLAEADVNHRFGAIILGLREPGAQAQVVPHGATRILPGAVLVVAGRADGVEALLARERALPRER